MSPFLLVLGLPSSALKLFAPNKCYFFSACGWKKLQFFLFCVLILTYCTCHVMYNGRPLSLLVVFETPIFFSFAIAHCLVYNNKKREKRREKRQTMSHRIALNE